MPCEIWTTARAAPLAGQCRTNNVTSPRPGTVKVDSAISQGSRGGVRCGRRRLPRAPSAGFEPAHMAPEATALSPELRGREERGYQGDVYNYSDVAKGPEERAAERRRAARRSTCFGIRDELRHSLSEALHAAGLPEPPNGVALEPGDPERGQGDWASPIAMQMTKAAKLPPREIADRVKAAIEAAPPPHLERVDVAGPGFLNFFLSPSWLHDVLREVVTAGGAYGQDDSQHG